MIWYPCSEFHNCTATIHQLPPQMQPLSLSHCGSQPNYPKINSCFTTTPKSQPLFPDHYYTKQICVSWPSLSLSLSPRYFVFDVCLHFSIFLFSFFFKKINVTFFILFFGFLLFWGWNVKIFVYIILYICLRADKIWKSR